LAPRPSQGEPKRCPRPPETLPFPPWRPNGSAVRRFHLFGKHRVPFFWFLFAFHFLGLLFKSLPSPQSTPGPQRPPRRLPKIKQKAISGQTLMVFQRRTCFFVSAVVFLRFLRLASICIEGLPQRPPPEASQKQAKSVRIVYLASYLCSSPFLRAASFIIFFVVLHPFVLKICLRGFPSRPPSNSKNDP